MGTWSISSNYISNGETLTGKLFFEEDKFCFKADSVSGKLNMGSIDYAQIKRVEYKNTFLVIPNGLLVVLKDETELLFIPLKRQKVKDFLTNKIEK